MKFIDSLIDRDVKQIGLAIATLTGVTLAQVNAIVQLLVGIGTLIIVCFKIAKLFRGKKDDE